MTPTRQFTLSAGMALALVTCAADVAGRAYIASLMQAAGRS